MASRNWENHVNHNITGLVFVNFEVTFDADAQANAFVIDRGANYLADTAFVRNGEGDWSFVLRDRYVSYGAYIINTDQNDVETEFISEDVDGSAGNPQVRIRFTTGSTGAAADPDSAKVYVVLLLADSTARIPS